MNPDIKGIISDMDGVILDTEKLYVRFWCEAANFYGYPMETHHANNEYPSIANQIEAPINGNIPIKKPIATYCRPSLKKNFLHLLEIMPSNSIIYIFFTPFSLG